LDRHRCWTRQCTPGIERSIWWDRHLAV